jgi:hypothetical protein
MESQLAAIRRRTHPVGHAEVPNSSMAWRNNAAALDTTKARTPRKIITDRSQPEFTFKP